MNKLYIYNLLEESINIPSKDLNSMHSFREYDGFCMGSLRSLFPDLKVWWYIL